MDNHNQIKFSILIPAYKSKFLKEAISSVLSQSYKNLELIIVDDCSPENLKSIVDGFSDSRMSYYRNEKNCGAENVVDNWNKCLSYASGDYVICMGDDDKLNLTCLADYVKIIEKYSGLYVYHTRTLIINEDSEIRDIQEQRPEYESGYSLWWHRWNGRGKQYIGDFLFDRKQLVKEGGFYNLPLAWASDDITAVRAALPRGIANVSSPGFCYRKNEMTISVSSDERLKANAALKEMEWYNKMLDIAQTQDEVDIILKDLIKRYSINRFQNKILGSFSKDINDNPLHLLFWYKNRNSFYLLKSIIVSTYINALKYQVYKTLKKLFHKFR